MSDYSQFKIPTMRTIKETSAITKVPEFRIRQLVKEKRITFLECGNKKALINLEKFIEFLNSPNSEEKTEAIENKYKIKPIEK